MEWRRNPAYRSRDDRERGLAPRSVTIPSWVWYVALAVVAIVLVASAQYMAALIFVGLTALGLVVQKFGVR
jgi:hypothetical protein